MYIFALSDDNKLYRFSFGGIAVRKFKTICTAIIITVLALVFCTGISKKETLPVTVETIVLSKGNSAPIAENKDINTYRGVSVSGKLEAYDAENENISFVLIKAPKYGEVILSEDGSFEYSPSDTGKSRDSFSFAAVDSSGNCSDEAEVKIKIEKPKSDVLYSDMENDSGEFAAVYLAEKGIFTGKCIGDTWYFEPDNNPTKAEFLAMCLKASGHKLLSGVTRTGLENDSELPSWVKTNISSAVLCGCFIDDKIFEYADSITYEEAVQMIDAVFEITDVVTASVISPYISGESSQAVNNLYFCGITDESIVANINEPLSMRDAAKMLVAACNIIEER